MKKSIFSLITLVLTLVLASAMLLPAFAADYEKEFDFLQEDTYKNSLVYTKEMKAAGNSSTMGYKGWVGTKEKESTSVFVFEAAEGKTFGDLVIKYRGYSIAAGAPDGIQFYVSTVGETDYAAGYTEANWTKVGALVNDATAGTGMNAANPADRSPELFRSIDVSAQAKGQSKIYLRIDFFRSANIDGVPATYFALAGATGSYAAAPVATEGTTAGTNAPAQSDTPSVTDPAPSTGDSPLSVALIICAAASVCTLAAVVISRRRKSAE